MRRMYLLAGDPADDLQIKRLQAEGTPELIGHCDNQMEDKLARRSVGWLLWQLEGATRSKIIETGKTGGDRVLLTNEAFPRDLRCWRDFT